MAAKRRGGAETRAAAVALPGRATRALPRGILPSVRSLLVGWAIVVLAGGAYLAARETSLFAIRRIEVEGVPAPVAKRVQHAAAGLVGTSMVGLNGGELLGRVDAVPTVYDARYDRAFPHTLRIFVRAERAVAVLRSGMASWLVSTRGRVMARLARGARPELPRIWVPSSTEIALGATLDVNSGGGAARALAPLARRRLPARVTSASLAGGELTFALAGGVVVRIGRPDDLRLKLAVTRQILRLVPPGTTYLDVSVPSRPVAGSNPQLSR